MTALLTASYPEVRADVARALTVARAHGDPVGEAAALALASLGEAYEGETEAAARFADAARGLTDALTDPDLTDLSEALVWLAWAETLIERYADAERHMDRGLEIARRGGQLHVLPHLLSNRAFVYLNTCLPRPRWSRPRRRRRSPAHSAAVTSWRSHSPSRR
ncbi:hypothetical protein HEP87_58185 [Streptomyces sp. S1D4-11]